MKIKKGDTVKVISGKSRGKVGKVVLILSGKDKIIVEGVNKVKKSKKKSSNKNEQGGIIEVESPIHVSNVLFLDPKTNKPTRLSYKVDKDGKKKRYSLKGKAFID